MRFPNLRSVFAFCSMFSLALASAPLARPASSSPGPVPDEEAAEEGAPIHLASLAESGASPGHEQFWEAIFLLGGDEPSQRRGRDLLRAAGEREFPPALTYLGECHLYGNDGFPRHPRRAAEWFRMAAIRGDAPGKAYLGACALFGTGTRRDRAAARRWLGEAVEAAPDFTPPEPPAWFLEKQEQRAAAQAPAEGSERSPLGGRPSQWEMLFARAHLHLGTILADEGDAAAALKLFESAATWGEQGRAGLADAARKAAVAHALGHGTPRDLLLAAERLELSRTLATREVMMNMHSLWTGRKLDSFDLGFLEKEVNEEADLRLEVEQESVADSLLAENPAEALRWCETAAEAGEGWAMLRLGDLLRTGAAGKSDPEAAFRWFRKAAEDEDLWLGWGNLAACHAQGIGTPRDAARVAEIVRRHGKRNLACALVGAGFIPAGDFSFRSWTTLLQQTAKRGASPAAQYHYALFLLHSRSTPRTAFAWLEPRNPDREIRPLIEAAAAAGLPEAWFQLGLMHEHGAFVRRQDLAKALDCYRRGLAAGSSECAHRLGIASRTPWLQEGPAATRAYFEKAIALDAENAAAHNDLGLSLEKLLRSHREDAEKAPGYRAAMLAAFEEASRLKQGEAALNLGRLHQEGELVPKDLALAYENFQLAAERDVAGANFRLGQMHERGEGVPRTPKEAEYYFRAGAAAGDTDCLRAVCARLQHPAARAEAPDRAIFWFIRLAESGEETALIHAGDALIEMGRHTDARRLFARLRSSSDVRVAGTANDRLGQIYEQGLGVKADARRAQTYYTRALAAQCPDTLCRNGRKLLDEGRMADAVAILTSASTAGSAEAAYLLAERYLSGKDESAGTIDGWALMQVAANRGHAGAKLALAAGTADGRAGAPGLEEALVLALEAEEAGESNASGIREKLEAMRGTPERVPVNELSRST